MTSKDEKISKTDEPAKKARKTKTVKAKKSEKTVESIDVSKVENAAKGSVENDKKNKISEKLKTMGVMGVKKKIQEKDTNTMASMWIALIVAIQVGMFVAYLVMPDQLSALFSLSTTDNKVANHNVNPQMPANPYTGAWNRNHEPEWVTKQRAEMKKRRSDFDSKNANYVLNRSVQTPQWVKDQQAMMKKEQEKRQQEWAKRSTQPVYDRVPRPPGYMNNRYSQNRANTQNAVPYYYNGNRRMGGPYGYNYGPNNGQYNVPYGQNLYAPR